MRVLERNRLDRRAALALLAGGGVLTNLPALACYTERRKRCEVLIAEPGLTSARAGNPAIDFGVRTMRDSLPDAARQAAPAPVVLGKTPDQSAELLQAAIETLDPLAAIVFGFILPPEVLAELAKKFGTPIIALSPAQGDKKASCLFHLLLSADAIASDCSEMLRAAGFTSGGVGIVAPPYRTDIADAIRAHLEKLGVRASILIGNVTGGEVSAALEQMTKVPNLVFIATEVEVRRYKRLLQEKNLLIVSVFADPVEVLQQGTPPIGCWPPTCRLSNWRPTRWARRSSQGREKVGKSPRGPISSRWRSLQRRGRRSPRRSSAPGSTETIARPSNWKKYARLLQLLA